MTIEIQNEIFFRLLSIVLIAPLGVKAKTSAVQIMKGERLELAWQLRLAVIMLGRVKLVLTSVLMADTKITWIKWSSAVMKCTPKVLCLTFRVHFN